ncbi:MFS transporter [Streptomyces coffeae]|uniref:MFS transporter n=1 Tax=Streptomyces coffeae TaxID=621382 RepID=UPI0035577AC9
MLLALATSASVASFLAIRSFWPFLVAACCYAVAQSGLGAARQALLAGLVAPGERTGVLAHVQSTVNAGLAVGAGLGGIALYSGTRCGFLTVFAVDAVSFLAGALVLRRLPAVTPVSLARGPALAVLRDRPFTLITLLNAVLLLRMPLLSLGIPLWISEHTQAPEWLVSALFLLNTLAVAAFQVRAARGVTSMGTAVSAVRRSGWILLLSCVVFAVSAAGVPVWVVASVLLAGAVLHVVGEMLHSAGSWQIAFGLAPDGRVGEYQGFFGTGLTVARTAGPLLLTALLVTWGVPGWLLLGGLFVAASYAMGPAVRWAERSRPAAPASAPSGTPDAETVQA